MASCGQVNRLCIAGSLRQVRQVRMLFLLSKALTLTSWCCVAEPANGPAEQEMKHDDVIGEAVCEEEALEAQKWATVGIIGQDLDFRDNDGNLAEALQRWINSDGSWRFAGSQPVSPSCAMPFCIGSIS